MSGKGLHYPPCSYDVIRIYSLMIYSDIIEHNILGDTKTPLLRCIPFISKVEKGDIIPTKQYMNYQFFTNLHVKKLLKNDSIKIELKIELGVKIELRVYTGKKKTFVSVGTTRFALMFHRISDNLF